MSTAPIATPFDDLTPSQGQSSDIATPFDDLVKPSASVSGPSPEEQQFLKMNPDHQWVFADPSRPNTQPGIYHKSAVADMAKDPTMEHHPVDLQFAKHTAEGAGQAALATVGPIAVGTALSGVMPFAEHISGAILEHGTELATKYPNFVKLAGKIAPHVPLSTLAALTYAYEKFKK